ncbi:LacI family DNA-binding transcriptional regulator [Streptomyces milbemycinicus]|uniref:LacI family DNA-binding transcriptional regulator n=1 Tax=Streptomyces milbemycinicus TaxID=476552 RepID=A0ABW8LC98_9ACTN
MSGPVGRQGRRPTIKAVAAAAGVSTAAVSQAFHGKGRLSEPTRQRILDAAGELGWSPSAPAAALRNARTRTLALVVRRPTDVLGADPHFSELITGIEGELAPRGYGLLLHLVAGAQEENALYRQLTAEGRVDGAVLTDARTNDPRPALLARLGLPAVLLGPPDRAGGVPSVGLGHQGAAVEEVVRHLLELGHRRIAYVAGPADLQHTRLRGGVFETALKAAGLRPYAVLHTDFTEVSAVAATRALLEAPDRATAIVYANDSMAVCGIGAAQRDGLRVPDDLSVVGYDNLPLGRWLHPRLTTVDQQVQRVGAAAARLLLARCGEDVEETVLDDRPRLVVRESTGPAPASPVSALSPVSPG